MNFKKEYDIFLAYHGSHEDGGSRQYATDVYRFLSEKGIRCFFFPFSGKDVYKANIIEVMKSRLFLLVCTGHIHTDEFGKIDSRRHYELSTEIDAFYALTQIGNGTVKDAKVLVCGECQKGREGALHELFANRTHLYYDGDAAVLDEVYDWVRSRLENTVTWNETQTTSEIREVFATRASMNQGCHFDDLIATAKHVRAVGISNSELTARINPSAIENCIAHGGQIEILFLDPDGKHTPLREQEEGLRPGRIRNITNLNIETAQDMIAALPAGKERFRLYTYDMLPRMNMIFVDEYLILQYYSNKIPGINNPSFFVEKKSDSPVFTFCERAYEFLKNNATPLEVI